MVTFQQLIWGILGPVFFLFFLLLLLYNCHLKWERYNKISLK